MISSARLEKNSNFMYSHTKIARLFKCQVIPIIYHSVVILLFITVGIYTEKNALKGKCYLLYMHA